MIIANIEDYRKECEARLPRFLYDYISGGSYQENTLRANMAELQATLLRQRVMVDESHLNLSIHLWDQAMRPVRLHAQRTRVRKLETCGDENTTASHLSRHPLPGRASRRVSSSRRINAPSLPPSPTRPCG